MVNSMPASLIPVGKVICDRPTDQDGNDRTTRFVSPILLPMFLEWRPECPREVCQIHPERRKDCAGMKIPRQNIEFLSGPI